MLVAVLAQQPVGHSISLLANLFLNLPPQTDITVILPLSVVIFLMLGMGLRRLPDRAREEAQQQHQAAAQHDRRQRGGLCRRRSLCLGALKPARRPRSAHHRAKAHLRNRQLPRLLRRR